MPKQQHGGRRHNQTGRPPKPPEQRMRRRSIGMLESDWQKLRQIAEAQDVSVDEIIRRLVRQEEK